MADKPLEQVTAPSVAAVSRPDYFKDPEYVTDQISDLGRRTGQLESAVQSIEKTLHGVWWAWGVVVIVVAILGWFVGQGYTISKPQGPAVGAQASPSGDGAQ